MEELKDDLARRFPQILGVHEMHVWSLVRGNRIATLHATFISQQVTIPHVSCFTRGGLQGLMSKFTENLRTSKYRSRENKGQLLRIF